MIQIYTGDGKGKTTACLGLSLRAAGAGLKVYIIQFLKKGFYNELKTIKKIPGITIEQFGKGCFIKNKPKQKDADLARKGLDCAKRIIRQKKCDIIILDEINLALYLGLLKIEEVIALMKSTPKKKELILTGRQANPEIIKLAHLVSEIKDVKHYYKKGMKARKGIEF